MTKKKIVLCLEDTPSRVVWLEGIAKEHGAVVHSSSSVKTFLALCKLCRDFGEVEVTFVLDHDLGGYAMPVSMQDSDGLDGMDAVEQMPELLAPVLVWSTNHIEAPRMEETLRKRNFTIVARMPWSNDRTEMAEQLHAWLA